ncbi:MAG: phosphate ABC transporter permease subunit PstC [Phycisphaerae bacterium]|nr:phosphate ABC transporter permease subunit PstC [Phycisphaerae bacterium]
MTALPTQPGQLRPLDHATGRTKSRALRRCRETLITASLIICGLFSILTTFAIIGVLLEETRRFFTMPDVSMREFFLTATWQPLLGAEKHFGIWPLVCGTMLVTGVAALLALPLGLITAIYLSEYAPERLRGFLKPVLEILAGIPTVVYGFFALTVITPTLQRAGVAVDSYNALSAGLAVGIMTLPIVCSLSEDALRAVPRTLREGAFACGGTRLDVSLRVVLPAALSGVIASFLLAIARSIGETMIVALAAGGLAQLTLDPRDQVQTMTGYMVQIFLGDASAAGVEYRSSYAVAFMLFAMTLVVTLVGYRIMKRFREEYQ